MKKLLVETPEKRPLPKVVRDAPKAAIAVVYRSLDPEAPAEAWERIHRDNVPAEIKDDPVCMGRMLAQHYITQLKDDPDGYWYRAERADPAALAPASTTKH